MDLTEKEPPKKLPVEIPKKSPKKGRKPRCDDKDEEACETGKICSVKSGGCIQDNSRNRKGMYLLEIDGRLIVGNEAAINDLKEILGGVVRKADAKKEVSREEPLSPKKKALPPGKAALKERLEKVEKESDEAKEIEAVLAKMEQKAEEKKSPAKAVSSPKGKRKTSPPRIQRVSDETRKAFMACIATLK